jgi:predicted MFS family arabinose efflux permease
VGHGEEHVEEILTGDQPATARRVDLSQPLYRNYILAVLFLGYVVSVADRTVLGVLLQSIKVEFVLSDTQLGLLGGVAFALFYSVMGVPIAALADRVSRRGVLSVCIFVWSGMTALCGMAVNFPTLMMARIGTAIGEAGGSPASHSLIADYFPPEKRGTALSFYALGVPLGVMTGNFLGGWGNQLLGWREAFMLVGLPGLLVAFLVRFTIQEPPRGYSEKRAAEAADSSVPRVPAVLRYLWQRRSFRHLSTATALHAMAWYGGSTWNAAFLIRSHGLTSGQAGTLLGVLAGCGAFGTFAGGYLSDRFFVKTGDSRWYMWVPCYATLIMVPFQAAAYLVPQFWVMVVNAALMVMLASTFFGPSFATTQMLVTSKMRAMAPSVLLFVQSLIGLGLGPFLTGLASDLMTPALGSSALRYALALGAAVNVWSSLHYFLGARSLKADLAAKEKL